MRRSALSYLPRWSRAALIAGALLSGGCLYAEAGVRVGPPPVPVAVYMVQPGWGYAQVGGTWYYAPNRGRSRNHRGHYVLRGGAWVMVH